MHAMHMLWPIATDVARSVVCVCVCVCVFVTLGTMQKPLNQSQCRLRD